MKHVLYAGECSCKFKNNHVINLLVLGQTGAGRSTWADSFINHIMGIEIYDNFRYKLVDESNDKFIEIRSDKIKSKLG